MQIVASEIFSVFESSCAFERSVSTADLNCQRPLWNLVEISEQGPRHIRRGRARGTFQDMGCVSVCVGWGWKGVQGSTVVA